MMFNWRQTDATIFAPRTLTGGKPVLAAVLAAVVGSTLVIPCTAQNQEQPVTRPTRPLAPGGGDRALPPFARPSPTKQAGKQPANVPVTPQTGTTTAAQPTKGTVPHVVVEPPAPGEGQAASAEDLITLSAFTEPVELTALVEYVAKAIGVNVTVSGNLAGTVVFNAPVSVKRGQLLKLLDALLEQQNFTITLDAEGFYIVHPNTSVPFNLGTDLPTTKIIPTPNIRPTALKATIESQISTSGSSQPGVQPGGIASAKGLAYVDELGVIVMTDTPRRIAAVESLVARLIEEYGRATFTRLELKYISAPVARSRALELVGQSSPSNTGPSVNPQTGEVTNVGQPGFPGAGGSSHGLNNLGDRLTVDPLGNALIFRGLAAEADEIKKILVIIDAPSSLTPRSYEVGSAAKQVAEIARDRGIGQVTLIAAPQPQNPNNPFQFNQFNPDGQGQLQNKTNLSSGGPVMVVNEEKGTILYYGTDEQQQQMETLIKQLKIEDERVTIVPYKLKHSDATKVSELILGLLQNTTPAGTSDLLPGDTSPQNPSSFSNTSRRSNTSRSFRGTNSSASTDGGLSLTEDERVFLVPDKANNQILVKAPTKDQNNYAQLIARLDQRRPQVYIEAKIVAITTDDRMRLAFENQLINANGTGGVLNTNFGLSSFGTTSTILNPKVVSTGLTGFTAAIIKSDQVPFIMTALARETNSKIISSPQLLVDDNEESTVVSLDQQPTTTISRGTGGSGDVVTSGDPAEAGTTLKVTPQISEGGYLRLKYEIELSSFTGEAQTVGSTVLPPPKQTNKISSNSITVPGESTVVVGGLVVDQNTKTVAKIPFLGDIPLIGLLFQDRNTGDRKTTLYIFLTPRIIRDPNFDDLRLLTRGPMRDVVISDDMPSIKPTYIEILAPLSNTIEERAKDGATGTSTRPTELPRPVEKPADKPANDDSAKKDSGNN